MHQRDLFGGDPLSFARLVSFLLFSNATESIVLTVGMQYSEYNNNLSVLLNRSNASANSKRAATKTRVTPNK